MKKNENKVANLIGNKVAQQLEGIKDATSKSKTTKAQGTKKTKAQLVEESQEAAKKFAGAKLVQVTPEESKPTKKTSKKAEVVKDVEKQQKPVHHRKGNLQPGSKIRIPRGCNRYTGPEEMETTNSQ